VWCIGIRDQHLWVSTRTDDICVVLEAPATSSTSRVLVWCGRSGSKQTQSLRRGPVHNILGRTMDCKACLLLILGVFHMWASTCIRDICVVLAALLLLCWWWVTTGHLQHLARYCMLARLLLLRESWSLSPSLPEAPSLADFCFWEGGGVIRRHSRHTSMALPTMLIAVGKGLHQALHWSCGGFGCRKKGEEYWDGVARCTRMHAWCLPARLLYRCVEMV
jgi:hypothetical protein